MQSMLYTEVMSDFWMSVIEKLNSDADRNMVLSEVIEQTCRYFDFGCGFIYVADHQDTYFLYESFKASEHYAYVEHPIDLREVLGELLYDSMYSVKSIVFDMDTEKSDLEQKLSDVFFAKSMILVPVKADGDKISAVVGMFDRRGRSRNENQDLTFASFIISVIANYVSTMLFRRKNEGAMKTLRNILDNTGVSVYVTDFQTDEVLYLNKAMAQTYGDQQELLGKKCWQVFMKGQQGPCEFCPKARMVDDSMRPTEPYIWNLYREMDDTWQKMISAAFYWIDGRLAAVMSNIDITETIRNEEKIQRYAEYDMLTGLKNRHRLLLDCDDGIDNLKLQGREGYLVFCDLDRFKQVNDKYTHQVGDELLRLIGRYFQENEQTRDKVYRYAGDEFVILCLDMSSTEVHNLIRQISEDFLRPWELSVGALRCTASLGVTCYPRDAVTTTDLLHSADMAMYDYKKRTYE